MATLEQLRAVFGGTSDEDTILTAAQKLRMPVMDIANEVGFTAGGQWSNRFGGSIDNYQAGLYDVGSAATGALGLQGVSDWMSRRREVNERQSEFARQAAKEQGAVTSYKDIGGFGDAANYLGGLAVDSLPYLGEAAVGGLLARGAMTGTRAAVSAARELGMPAAVQAGERALGRASLAGAVGASYPSAVGDIMSNQREEAGQTDGATAALLGVPYAAANAFGLEGAAARARLFRPAVNWFDEATGVRGGLKRAGVTALGTGLQEGAGETFQEVMNQAGRNAVNPEAGYFGPQAMERYLESFVGGAALGGVMGGAGGGWRRSEGYRPPVSDDPLNPTDLLTVERGFDARKPLDGFVPEGPRPGSRVVAAPAEVPQWGLARGAMDPAPTHPTVGEATDLFRMPTDGEPRIVGGYDPRLAGLFVGPTQPGAAPIEFSPPMTDTAVPPLSPPVAVDPLGAVTGPLYVDDVAEGNSRWREQPADIASPVIGRMEGGRQTPISGADDPGLALARQRYEEQLRQAEQTRTTNEAVQAKAEEQRREAERVQGILGGKIKPGSKVVGMVQELEAQLKAGVIDQSTFENDAALLSNSQLGTVRKNIDARNKEQANAAGAGTDGAARPADVGRGAGNQRAPGQPGDVRPAGAQPAAQGVAGAGTAELGPAGGRGDGALTGDQIVERIRQLDPVEQAYVGRWLGVDLDEDGNLALREQGAESLRAMEKTLGVSYETVRERVKAALVKLGLPKGMKPKQLYEQLGLTAANTDLETLERNVDTSTPASEAGTGDLDTIVEAADEGALEGVGDTDVRVERAQTASDELVPEIPDQDPMGRQREVAGPIDEGSMDVEDRVDESRALTLDSALEGDVSAGRVTADDIAEAQFFYEQNRRHGMQPWGRLNAPTQAEFVRVYARARLAADPAVLTTKKALYEDTQRTVGRGGSAVDSGATRGTESRSTDGRDTAAQEGDAGVESGGSAIQAARGPVPVVTKRKRRVVQPERADEDVNWGNQLASAEEGGATLDRSETTKVTREQVLSQGPFAKAAESLRALGLGHMLDWVGEWRSAGNRDTDVADGWLEGYGSQYVLTLKDASALGTSANATWVMLHELGHAADLAPSGGVYSAHPDMRFEMADGRAVGRGAVAAEMAELYENDPWWSAVLQYPLDARRYGVTDGETVAGELFAQLFAMYVDPKGRAKLQLDAPLAFQFIQESVNDIQATRPLRVRTPGEVKGRAQAFARRYRGVSSGQSAGTAAGGNAGAGGRALRAARSALNKIGKSRGRMPDLAALIVGMRDAGLEAAARFLGRADVRELLDKLAQHASITDIDRYTEFWRDELSGGDKDARFPGDYNFGRVQVRNAVGPRDVYKFKVSDELAQDLEAIDIATNNIFNQFMEERGKPTLPEAPTYPGKDPFYHDERMKNPQYAREYAAYERQIRAANARMDAAHNEFARRYGISPRDYGDSSLEFRNPPPFEALYDGHEDPHPEDRDPARIAQERLWALLNSIADARKVAADDAASDSVNRLVGSVSKPLRSARNSAADALTPAFRKWFGDSKVVDERGEPLVMYHGTDKDFEAFRDGPIPRSGGVRLIFTSPDPSFADGYTHRWGDGSGGRVIPLYVRAENPFDPLRRAHQKALESAMEEAASELEADTGPGGLMRQFSLDSDEALHVVDVAMDWVRNPNHPMHWRVLESKSVMRLIRDVLGHDAMYVNEGGVKNIAVFSASQVKSIFNQNPTDDPRILRSARNSAADQVAALGEITKALPQPAQNAWTDIKDFAARKMPYVMTTFQIFEQFGSKLKRLGDMIRANDLMRQESIALQMKIDEIVKRWDKLPKAAGELLTDVATRATMLGAYPDKAWAGKENAHVPRERQAEYEELRRLYERMKSTSPEALKLYHETLDAFEAQREQLEAATKRMFDQYGKVMPKPKRTPGPYFPLVRRGDYLAIGESPRLVALKKRLEQAQEANADEATITDLNEQIDQLEKDDQHFWVSSHEKRSGMEQALKEYERRGLVARRSLASQRLDALPTRNIHSTIAALTAEATKNLSKDGAKEVGNALAEILLRSLPEGHALERQASRRNISGAMQDMKRAVAVAGRQNAYYIARLNHAKEVSDALFEMGRDVKGDINLQHVHRELEQRHALNMQWHETPIQDAIGKAGWMWYLGASPMFLMMNAAQPWLVSAPVMAGQYGASAASRELSRATADALAVLKKARWTGGKFDLWSGIDPDTIQSRFKSRNAKGEEIGEDRKAVRELILRGVIDEGLSPELAMYAESGGTGMLTKLSRFVSWPSQQIELVNRVATALAAFRLERGVTKAGETAEQAYERALEKAYATVVNTHVDYGAENAPRAMREGGGIPLAKLIFQFRRYQQAMLYLLASNVKKLRDPNEQKVARATLAYLAITSGMAGGAIGLPLAGTAMFLADLFGDDDDEDGDTRTKLRNALRDLTGDKTTADVLAKGLPALFGFDIAERVGMGQVGQLFPRLDLSRSKTAEDKVAKTLLAVAGPGAGLAVQGMDAASFFGAGDFWRGAERLSPKMVADLMRAGREGLTGVEDRKGETLLSPEERSIGDTIRRALGASSVRESDRFAADKALKDVERGMNARRDRTHTEFRRALRSGDFEDVREMIDEYNADHPDAPIKPKDELAWRKEAQRAGRERDPETGLKVTRRQQPLAEVQRFAQP